MLGHGSLAAASPRRLPKWPGSHFRTRRQTQRDRHRYRPGMVIHDVRDTHVWQQVADHFRQLHEPAFGRANKIIEPSCSADGTRIAVTGFVYDELAGMPRQQAFVVHGDRLAPLTTMAGSSRLPKVSPAGTEVAFLSDRAEAGRFQLYLLRSGKLGEAEAAPHVPGTVEYCSWSSDGTRILLGVAGLGADLAGGQGSGTTYKPKDELPDWFPHVEAGASEESWRSLWVFELATGTLTKVSPEGLNIGKACGSGRTLSSPSRARRRTRGPGTQQSSPASDSMGRPSNCSSPPSSWAGRRQRQRAPGLPWSRPSAATAGSSRASFA